MVESISKEQLRQTFDQYVILDVREPDEIAKELLMALKICLWD